MNKLGIIVAEEEELIAIKEKLTCINEAKYFGVTFILGKLKTTECILVRAGIGKVNAARTTQLLIDKFSVDYIINAGSAGSLVKELFIGNIVIADKCVQIDFDLTDFGREKGEIPDLGKYFYSDKELVEKCTEVLNDEAVIGTIATSDTFISKESTKKQIGEFFNAKCCEMEGASIAQVCTLCEIPFIIIRSISDELNDNSKIEFSKYLKQASKKCANFIENMIK